MNTQPHHTNPIPDTPFDAAVTRALEQAPATAVPADFAARVRAALPSRPPARARRSLVRVYSTLAIVALLVTLCVLAPHARPSFTNLAFDLELTLLLELAGIVAWLTHRRT
jgi:hypothetical protein